MKKIVSFILFTLLVPICLFSQEATPTPEPAMTCQPALSYSYGYVTDAGTGEPISDATIVAEAILGTNVATTDINGYYTLYISTCMMGEAATFTVSAQGYEDLVVTRGSHGGNDFSLTPASGDPTPEPTPGITPVITCPPVIYRVEGHVLDGQTNRPIGGATITVQGTTGAASAISDSYGAYTIFVPNCLDNETAAFTVTADGYEQFTISHVITLTNSIDFNLAPTCLPGDVSGDGIIDIIDALLVAQYYTKLITVFEEICGADVNCDNEIDIIDALLIAQYYVKIINIFPCN